MAIGVALVRRLRFLDRRRREEDAMSPTPDSSRRICMSPHEPARARSLAPPSGRAAFDAIA
jgi:hypothetical protein